MCVQLIELEMFLSEVEVVGRAVSFWVFCGFLLLLPPLSCLCSLDSFCCLLVLECAGIVAHGGRGEERRVVGECRRGFRLSFKFAF